jgi:hypothetical protein
MIKKTYCCDVRAGLTPPPELLPVINCSPPHPHDKKHFSADNHDAGVQFGFVSPR